jgi:predicted Zn-dependent peptidase
VFPNSWKLNNEIPVYEYNLGSQDIIKIEFVFNAGTKYQPKSLIASTVKNLMKEGTEKYTSKEIADCIDFYGAFLETDLSNDRASVSLFCLNKYIDNVLPIVADVILNAKFPQNEIDGYLKRQKQNFIIGQEKVSTLASQAYVKNIFNESQYGQYATINDYDNITRDDCINFYKKHYTLANLEIFIAGKSTDFTQQLLNEHIGNIPAHGEKLSFNFKAPNFKPSNNFVKKEGAIQSAIRFGKPLFTINHPDFIAFQVLNTVLGGYFGSRLMTNIREDKGYTYGIGSGISSKQEMGNFIISTEVGSDVTQNAIDEIKKEIDILKETLVPEEELNVVKSYILGALLKNTDGPFDMLSRFQTIHFNNLSTSHYDNFINEVKAVTAEKLRELANEHLTDLSIIVAGSKDFK